MADKVIQFGGVPVVAHDNTDGTYSLGVNSGAAAAGDASAANQSTQITAANLTNTSLGATTDAVVAAGAAGSIAAKLRAISRDIVANIVLAAGGNVIGKVGIDQTTPGTTNLVALAANQSVNTAQINGVAPTMGNGASGTGVQRVTIASDSTGVVGLSAGSAIIGKVGIDHTTPGTTDLSASISGQAAVDGNSGTIGAATQRVALGGAATGTTSSVADAASSAQLLAANTARKGAVIWNDSTQKLYLKYGTTASATDCTYKVDPDAVWEMPPTVYNGRIDGIWAADASGSARITELT